jgi:hypothetical protein
MVPYFGSLDLSTYERAAMKNAEWLWIQTEWNDSRKKRMCPGH